MDTEQSSAACFHVGEKLRALRQYRAVTQSELAGEHITRNMLSQIERGAALPSYATILYLAQTLRVDPSYFFPNGPSLDDVVQSEALELLRPHYLNREFDYCFRMYDKFCKYKMLLSELSSIFADCAFRAGVNYINSSEFAQAEDCFTLCEHLSVHSPGPFEHKIAFYRSVIRRTLEGDAFLSIPALSAMSDDQDYADLVEYFFLCGLIENGKIDHAVRFYDELNIRSQFFRIHISARLSAAVNNYVRAKELLRQIVASPENLPYPFVYSVYCDLERYCKATEDYEGAYRCAVDKQKYRFDAPASRM